MCDDTSDKMLTRIRALLAKAENEAATPAEAKAYTAKAAELIAKYGIDRALLAASDPTTDSVGDRIVTVPAPYARAKAYLLDSIAKALGVKGVLRPSPKSGAAELHLFGMQSDLERVEILYTSLLVQLARSMTYDFNGDSSAWSNPKTWRRDYIEGFRSAVAQRLQAAEQRARQQADSDRAARGDTGPSVALVLVGRGEKVERRVAETYPRLRQTRSSRRIGAGYTVGNAAGARADLGGTRMTGGRRNELPTR